MRPFYFGRSERLLFGTYHAPVVRTARPAAVLLCNPYGQESIQAHRIYATLASKLSKAGQHVLRFDYYGTGDSAGDADEGSQAEWVENIIEAHEELLSSSGVPRITWMGLRFGATLAVLAGQSLRRAIASLILWDPVVDGAAYLHELVETHATFMQRDMRGWRPAGQPGSESLGFPLTPDLKRTIGAIDLNGIGSPKARQVTILTTDPKTCPEGFRNAVAGWTSSTQFMEMRTNSPWNSDDAMNAMLVPMDVLDAIVARVQETP